MTERSTRTELPRLGWIALAIAVVALLGASPAGAETTPAVTVAPATGLVDGQSVAVTAAGFLAVSSSGGTFVPAAFQCAPVFPMSAVFVFVTAQQVVGPLLNHNCTPLGQFPVTHSTTTSRVVSVSRAFTSGDGTAIACGMAPGDCSVVVVGLQPGFAALASASISFAATPTRKAECRHGGWRRLVDAHGMPFANQRRCIRFVRTGHST